MTEKGQRGGLRPGAGRKKDSLRVDPLFKFTIWLMVEIISDRQHGLKSEAYRTLAKVLEWKVETIATHYKEGRKLAEEREVDSAALLQSFREKRESQNWQTMTTELFHETLRDIEIEARRATMEWLEREAQRVQDEIKKLKAQRESTLAQMKNLNQS
jgi:hypothetical protein